MKSLKRAVSVIFPLFLLLTGTVSAQDEQLRRSIQVTGEAEVKVIPDEVVITLGVETYDEDLMSAQVKNERHIQAVLSICKNFGIEGKNVKTDHVNIRPVYPSSRYPQEIEGYVVRKAVVITLRDITRFEPLLVKSLESGVNYVHGISFQTTELRKYRDQARALAIKAAREKAEDLAKELGMKIGKPITISEGYSRWFSGYNSWWGHAGGRMMSQNVVQSVGSGGSASEGLAPGQISVNASVNVQFELQ